MHVAKSKKGKMRKISKIMSKNIRNSSPNRKEVSSFISGIIVFSYSVVVLYYVIDSLNKKYDNRVSIVVPFSIVFMTMLTHFVSNPIKEVILKPIVDFVLLSCNDLLRYCFTADKDNHVQDKILCELKICGGVCVKNDEMKMCMLPESGNMCSKCQDTDQDIFSNYVCNKLEISVNPLKISMLGKDLKCCASLQSCELVSTICTDGAKIEKLNDDSKVSEKGVQSLLFRTVSFKNSIDHLEKRVTLLDVTGYDICWQWQQNDKEFDV